MINREEYLDDYGLQVDPLFDLVDGLHKELEAKDKKLIASRKATHGYIERQDKVIDEQSDQLEANKKEIAELTAALNLSTSLHREGLEEYIDYPDTEKYNDRVCDCIRKSKKLLTKENRE